MTTETPTTESGRALRGNMCWALHALSTDHTVDCDVVLRGILAIEAAAQAAAPLDVERLARAYLTTHGDMDPIHYARTTMRQVAGERAYAIVAEYDRLASAEPAPHS